MFLFGLILLTVFKNTVQKKEKICPPNIIYIMADDPGYGDLGIYGKSLFATTNLDRLAKGGMRFLQQYSGSTLCTLR